MNLLILILTILTIWQFISCQPENPNPNLTNYRLPTNAFPTSYELNITTFVPGYGWPEDERSGTYEGVIYINFNVTKATKNITMNLNGVEIVYAMLWDQDVMIQYNPEHETVTFGFEIGLDDNDFDQLIIDFRGKFRDDAEGFYITNSTRENGEILTNVVTQFEPAKARMMVPCFDEPEFKATWNVTINHPKGSTALSNSIETTSEDVGDFTVTHFKETVKMSSYLLALFVGDVEYKETKTDKGLRIRVYADPVNSPFTEHALNVSRITVEGFEKLFGIDFPMEKLDFVSVESFTAGAMENWGLIVHKQNALIGTNDWITTVVIHELAHQWFGNLVTMKYWNQIWLNEGFASFMESYGWTFINPDYDRSMFFLEKQLSAEKSENYTALDGIEYEADGSIGIVGLNYSKGSSFLRMLELIVGESAFIEAIRTYLSSNSYGNVDDNDLYDALKPYFPKSEDSPESLKEFSKCWTHQNGYPTLHAELKNQKLVLTQREENPIVPAYNVNDVCGYKWDIPIWYQELGQENITMKWFTKEKYELELDISGAAIINANSNGYYDVYYSDVLYQAIVGELNTNIKLYSDSTLLRLLNDVIKYFIQKKTSLHNVIIIADALTKSENYEIVKNAKDVLMIAESHVQILNKINEDDLKIIKSHEKNETQSDIFEDCDASESFSICTKKKFKDEKEICFALGLHANNVTTKRIIDWFHTEKSAETRANILSALSCSDEEEATKLINDNSIKWSSVEKLSITSIKSKAALKTKQNQRTLKLN